MDVPGSDEPAQPAEVYEHIPWAQLAAPSRGARQWIVYLAAGAIAVASLGALVARSIERVPQAPLVVPPTTAAAPAVTTPPPKQPPAGPLTEADLLAAAPGRREVSAAARAEWFVADYFSTGGDPGSHREVLDALPDGSQVPKGVPQGTASYVDWVATSRVEAVGDGQFRSTVLFRTLVSSGEDAAYTRLPVRAVDVVVEVGPGGGTRVIDLPIPVVLPDSPPAPSWADPAGEVPDAVRTGGLALAGSWGGEPSLLEASERESGWRMVVEVVDEAGIRWPLTLWLTDQGEPVWPEVEER
jgi:hypothetical protein